MGKQATEMLKGTLEGIVLGILSDRPAYGYEITGWLREQGFTDIAEGTIYALLLRIEQRGYVDVAKEPSEKGPPRKVYTLNEAGELTLREFWSNWSFLAERIDQLRTHVETPAALGRRAEASGTETPLTATSHTEGEQS
jgi:PadR family transcriptional regulator PadR